MTTPCLNLCLQVGPDHHFLVVPAVGEFLFFSSRRVVLGPVMGLPGARHSAWLPPRRFCCFSSFTAYMARSPWYPFPFPPCAVLTSDALAAHHRLPRVIANLVFCGCCASDLQRVGLMASSPPLVSSHPFPLLFFPFHISLLPHSVTSLSTAC